MLGTQTNMKMSQEMLGRNSHKETLSLTEQVGEIVQSFIIAFCCIVKGDPAKVLGTLGMDE